MPRKLAQSILDSVLDSGEAAVNSAVTVAARLPILSACLLSPSARGMEEWQKACSEKVLAAWEGGFAVCTAWNSLMWRAALAPLTPAGFATESLLLARAATQPAHLAVRANAARLGR